MSTSLPLVALEVAAPFSRQALTERLRRWFRFKKMAVEPSRVCGDTTSFGAVIYRLEKTGL
jgi:hypothetical protein